MVEYLTLTLPGSNGQPGIQIKPPQSIPQGGAGSLGKMISGGITIFLIIIIVLALISIVRAGIQMASSSGDKSKVAAARGRITWAIVGLIVALLAFMFVNILGSFFNIDLLK
jgi:hypothetical protein